MDKKLDGLWVVIFSEGKSFIGKAVQIIDKDGLHNDFSDVDILEAHRVTLKPAYDFFSPLRPVPVGPGEVGYSRDPVVTPFDFAMEDVPVHVRVGTVMFFNELSEKDRQTYEQFVDRAEKTKLEGRVQRSGLHLAK